VGSLVAGGQWAEANLRIDEARIFFQGQGEISGGLMRLHGIEGLTGHTNFSTRNGDTLVGDGRQNLIIGKRGPDTLRGLGSADVIQGDSMDDSIEGGAGDDVLDGGSGTNSIDGGPGEDHCTNPDAAGGALRCESP